MDKKIQNDVLLTAAECAARTGLSVKTLRVYEAQGLITPKRTDKNWRLYGTNEIVRLNEVMILKQLGLSLSKISELLSGQPANLERLLEIQATTLRTRSAQIETSLRLIGQLQLKAKNGLSMEDLLSLAKETHMHEATDDIAWRRYEQARPRTQVEIDPKSLTDYVGDYRFEDGLTGKVRTDAGKLFGGLLGQPEFELFAEAPDKFFLKITPAQVTFDRDEIGLVQGLILHQEGFELKANRCEPGTYQKAEDALQDRVKANEPYPGSADQLRTVIAECAAGTVNHDDYTPQLASVIHEQLQMVGQELERLGPLKSLDFRGVGAGGYDLYTVDFENGRLEWGLSKAADGRLNGLFMRPAPCDIV
jgi:DNA-binding transcriptional MerR regulator